VVLIIVIIEALVAFFSTRFGQWVLMIAVVDFLLVGPFAFVYALFASGDETPKHQQLVCDQIIRHPGDHQCRWVGPQSDDLADVYERAFENINNFIFNDIMHFVLFLIAVAILYVVVYKKSTIPTTQKSSKIEKMGYDENGDPYPGQLKENLKNWNLDSRVTVDRTNTYVQEQEYENNSTLGRDAGIVGVGLGVLLARNLRK